MQPDDKNATPPQVGPAYAAFQLAKALRTSETHDDPDTRARAREWAASWLNVIAGLASGKIRVGSRTPLENVPSWVTPEVVTGGFATGSSKAGGKIQKHERQLLHDVGVSTAEDDVRRTLNAYFLSDAGIAHLQRLLDSGCYEIQVPEEGALLVIAALLARGRPDEAHGVLEKLGPFLDQLRFYPVPTKQPPRLSSRVFLADVHETRGKLLAIKPNKQLTQFREAVVVWRPMYDRLVQLFLETVEGTPPSVEQTAERSSQIQGGWPCQVYAADWQQRTAVWLREFAELRKRHQQTNKPLKRKEHFAQLIAFARKCTSDPRSLTGREVGHIRMILAHHRARHGAPDCAALQTLRAEQARLAHQPLFADIAGVVARRMSRLPGKEGLDDLASVAFPITDKESLEALPAGTLVPAAISRRVKRALYDTVESHIERGLITSGEVVARLLPQIFGQRRANEISNPELQRLYAGIYQAFRRRRSLLLLNLQSQVQLEELPWVGALEEFRHRDVSAAEAARSALAEVASLVISAFPQAILPNRLLQEFRALTKDAGLSMPLVDELAADIFMGQFSDKFIVAAKHAAAYTSGTLYARYYQIDAAKVAELPIEPIGGLKQLLTRRAAGGDALARLCASRAGVPLGTWRPATNGMIIEQQQILTTHNLAILFDRLELLPAMRERLLEMARHCFSWVVRRLNVEAQQRHARLVTIKNSAYAWRQMIFYLSFVTEDEQQAFLDWADTVLEKASQQFRETFQPIMQGLIQSGVGKSLREITGHEPEVRQLLGWSADGHWLA